MTTGLGEAKRERLEQMVSEAIQLTVGAKQNLLDLNHYLGIVGKPTTQAKNELACPDLNSRCKDLVELLGEVCGMVREINDFIKRF